jgi:hypothetical protein
MLELEFFLNLLSSGKVLGAQEAYAAMFLLQLA